MSKLRCCDSQSRGPERGSVNRSTDAAVQWENSDWVLRIPQFFVPIAIGEGTGANSGKKKLADTFKRAPAVTFWSFDFCPARHRGNLPDGINRFP
jgi:hypothetical protein